MKNPAAPRENGVSRGRGVRHVRILILTLLLAAPGHGEADDLGKLWEEYRALASNQDVEQKRRRRELSGRIGRIGGKDACQRLLQILEKDRDIRTRIAALLALTPTADEKDLKKAWLIVRKERKSVLPDYMGAALCRLENDKARAWALKNLIKSSKRPVQLGVIEALGHWQYEAARAPLTKIASSTFNSQKKLDVAFASLRALGRIGGGDTETLLLRAAESKQVELRMAAAAGLPWHGRGDATRAAWQKLLGDGHLGVARTAALTAGRARAKEHAPALIEQLGDKRLFLRGAARDGLAGIAGKDLGTAPDPWRDWLKGTEQKKNKTVADTVRADKLSTGRVLFLLDISKSMTWPSPTRLSIAKREIIKLLKRLDRETRFNVMTYAGYEKLWERKKKYRKATPRNLDRALQWVQKQKYVLYTNVWDALEAALEHDPELDTIYFFTDGSLPVGGNYFEPEEILVFFERANRFRCVQVHAIGLMWGTRSGPERYWKMEDTGELETFCRQLAELTGGTYRTIFDPYKKQ
jgi:HEAT repeat protein